MSSGNQTSVPPRLERPLFPSIASAVSTASLAVIIGAVTGAVLAASAAAAVAGVLAGGTDAYAAAALGATGGIAAVLVIAAAVMLVKQARSGSEYALIEAGSPAHPLMRRLMSEAPGTYVHSLAAANIAEAAAEAVGADALLTRIGAYYHDVGKLAQPCYFHENQEEGCGLHDPAQPEASACTIIAHVEDGVALARRHGLPASVLQIISQHHGTSLVRYFFDQASRTRDAVSESDFRYGGEPPCSREAAIVMLADGSEASVRAMTHPDAHEVEVAVRNVVAERLVDGQLKDSGLTDTDLERVIAVFSKRLVSFRHVRCPYPTRALDVKGECECR